MLKLSLKEIDDDIAIKVSKFCDNTHLGEAYSEYCKKVKNNWEYFVSLVTNSIDKSYDYLADLDETDPKVIFDNLQNIGSSIFSNTNHFIVSLSNSFMSTADFCKYLAYLIMNDEDITISFPNFEWQNSIVKDKSLTLDDVLQDINAIWHSITVDSATAETLSLTEGLSISERLSAFRDVISRTFSSAFDDVSGYLGRCQDMITHGLSAMEVWRENLKDSGILEMAEGKTFYPSESINYQYHGSSPSSAYYWDTVADKTSSTIIAIGNAIISGTNWLLNKGKKWTSNLWNKAVKVVQEKAINPHDLEIINDQGNYTVDTTFSSSVFSLILDTGSTIYKDLVTNNKSIKIETKFAEHIMQRVMHSSGTSGDKILYFEDLIQALRLWYMKENGISQSTPEDFNLLPNTVADLSRGIINHEGDEYNNELSIIENFQNSRFKLYFNPITLMDIIRINFSNSSFAKVTVLCKTKYKPINTNVCYKILKEMCLGVEIPGYEHPAFIGTKLKPEAYDLIFNMQDLYFVDVTNEVEMYNSIFASYVLETIFWGDAIGDYAYYIPFIRGNSIDSNLFDVSNVGYSISDMIGIALGSVNYEEFCDNFEKLSITYQFFDTFDTEDSFVVGIETYKAQSDVGFKSLDSTITNLDYFNLCSLTNRVKTFNYQDVINNNVISSHMSVQLPTISDLYIPKFSGQRGILSMIQLYFSAFVQESVDPLHFKFVPYTTGRIDFKNSMFRIRTDSENILAFNNFITGIVVGIIAITAVISSAILIKSVVRKSLIIRSATKRRIENKLLNKEPLTSTDLKRYARYTRKQSKLSTVIGNTIQSSNGLSNDNILDANDKIISLIVG